MSPISAYDKTIIWKLRTGKKLNAVLISMALMKNPTLAEQC